VARQSALIDTRVIYCGDCLDQLRKLPDACIDLIYIDPPFNSNRNYEVFWGETKEKRAFEDRHASTQAYIDFMRPRCEQLARVLKPTGSFYYHCDWHASHYVKVMLDQIFGENQFQAEIVWKRSTSHSDAKGYAHVHDSVHFYAKTTGYTWNTQFRPYTKEYEDKYFRFKEPDGRRYWKEDATGAGPGPPRRFGDRVIAPPAGRHWRWVQETIDDYWEKGRFVLTKSGKPEFKRYLDEQEGEPVGDFWDDIKRINMMASERLGYPTQKPLALLDRIIKASSNENDVVLDAFCGCGTALVAAEKLKRQWIGIDISPTACRVMAKRLRKDCGLPEDEALWKAGRGFVVRDLPWSEEQLRKIPPFEFENWAVIALGGIPNKAQVGDMGIDGRIFPVSAAPTGPSEVREGTPGLGFMDEWYPIQVKQKDKMGRPEVDQFETAMQRANRKKGFLVAFDYSDDATREIDAFFRRSGCVIVPLTVNEILTEQLARKLA
jgi:DNA modification methylase